jgi:hypothetical protein
MGFGLMMEKKIPDGEVEMHGPNFLDGRFPRPTGPLLPVKISRFSIQPVARVALGAGQGAERQNGTNENRVESDSLGSFFLRKPSPAGVVNPCLAWLACHQAASIGIDMGSCTWACRRSVKRRRLGRGENAVRGPARWRSHRRVRLGLG